MDILEFWNKSSWKMKLLAWVFGTLLLGAIASGFWDVVLSRVFSWCVDFGYSITIFGIVSIRDSAYLSAARGLYEAPSLFNMIVLALFVVYMSLVAVMFTFIKSQTDKDDSFSKLPDFTKQLLFNRKFALANAVNSSLAIGFILFQTVQMAYVNKVVAEFNQSIAILAPVLTEVEEETLRASFASMKTGADYDYLVEELKSLAANHQVELPKL